MTCPIAILLALLALSSCSAEHSPPAPSPGSDENAVVAATTPTEPPSPNPYATFDTGHSVRTLMNAIVDPNAKRIWHSIRYVVTEKGVQEEVFPITDEDWTMLRESAVALVEGGNALLIPGRVMDDEVPGADYPAYKYRPEETQALLEANPDGWAYYIQQMQFSTNATLEAIERRDVLKLEETSAVINNACEGCHAEFWYRPNR